MFIRSQRLFLRPVWPEDSEEIFSRISDAAIIRNLSQAPWPYTAGDARRFVEREQDPHCPSFLVTVPGERGRLIGGIGLSRNKACIELGYWIGRDDWGRGFATEAVRALLPLAWTLGHRRIAAAAFFDNIASARVLEKCGFRTTGEVVQRYSHGRGTHVATVMHEIALDEPCDCCDPATLCPDSRIAA